ncbi:MAG: O-antigen ligase family protein [Flavobacteriales bacterium]|nr:O-antigen ligase family protein [Flavobacteriales bacterium]
MPSKQHSLWVWLTAGLFLVLNTVLIALEFYFIALLPLVLLVIWAAFMRLDWLMLFIIACVPLSINLEQMDLGGIGFYLPTEPLLFGVLVMFIFKLLSGKSIDKRILTHPVSYVLYFYLGWMTLTTITSEYPLVSLKYLFTRMWFIAGFYFILAHIFQDKKNIQKYFLFYLFPLFIVIIYTVVRHAGYGFDKEAGHWVMEPFYKDHTSYGAVLAMYFPVAVGLLISRKMNPLLRAFLMIGFVILCVGVVLSYTRAAWVSIAAVTGLLGLMLLRIKLRTLLLVLVGLVSFVWVAQDQLLISLERNDQDSSDDLAEHVESISNVSSDASNLERLNRWNSALAMFEERPVFGWGPGTYQFVYAPFQRSQDLTIISTNNADGGNAHSEYLGPLSEQGVLGSLAVILLVLVVSGLAFRLTYSLESYELKVIVLSVYLGLMTYFVHGVLNNYLDTDKASAPFWGFIAVLVAIDVFHSKKTPELEKEVD